MKRIHGFSKGNIMTRLLVCFHSVADLDMLSESEWISGGTSGYIDACYLKKSINCFDESALELACRFSDDAGSQQIDCTCAAVTAAEKNGDRFLQTLAAVGFTRTDRIHLLNDSERNALTSEQLSSLLFSYIQKQEPFDLILAGTQSADGSQGKTPLLLAELLDIRCITQVTDFHPIDDTHASVSYYRDDALCEEVISYPALLVIGNAADTYLRVPTLKQRMQSKKQPIAVYEPAVLSDTAQDTAITFCSMEPCIQTRETTLIDGDDPRETAAIMYDHYKKWEKL